MKISVIIPTLNEEAALPLALACPDFAPDDVEIIVSDGGSSDATCRIAKAAGAKVVTGTAGRGQQLARGAAIATGEALLFLHADTRLASRALGAIRQAVAIDGATGGNFRLVFDGPLDFAAWLTDFYAKLRRRGIYYGDSAVFVRRDVYDALGGFRPIALMEDFDFVRRLEAYGGTVCIETPHAVTSSRRFEDRKPWRIFGQWLTIHALYWARMSPDRLANLYRSRTHAPGSSTSSRSASVAEMENYYR